MGFFDKIAGFYNRAIQAVKDAAKDVNDLIFNLPNKIKENSQLFIHIFNTNWLEKSIEEKETSVESVKKRVIHDLIPAAGQFSILGAPGIMVYTPCQIIGALAIAHIYNPEYTITSEYMLTVAAVMIWGKTGQVAWTELIKILASLFPQPAIGIAMIPYVQVWTELALDKVHDYYHTEFLNKQKVKTKNIAQPLETLDSEESFLEKPKFNNLETQNDKVKEERKQIDNSSEEKERFNNLETKNSNVREELKKIDDSNSSIIDTSDIQNSELIREANKLLQRINQGGKVLFPAQEEVFRELVQGVNNQSALILGQTHIFRGVAGSGKTIVLGQLVPHLAETFRARYGRYPLILVYHHNNYINQLLSNEIRSAIRAPINIQPLSNSFYEKNIHIHNLSTLRDELFNRRLFNTRVAFNGITEGSERAKKILTSLKHHNGVFDIAFVDEGQDITQEEYTLINTLCNNNTDTKAKSIYIFYDDLQNIFDIKDTVLERLQHQKPIEHFLSRCVRTSKKLMDFTFNTCLGASIDKSSRIELEHLMNLNQLKQRKLITEKYTANSNRWFDCNFCVFPGELTPEVRQFSSNRECYNGLAQDIRKLVSEHGLEQALEGGVLIQCFNNNMVWEVFQVLYNNFSDRVKRRSGSDINSQAKRTSFVVEKHKINVSLVWDAKGYDANIVYVINPDGGKGTSVKKRAQFYVAATRAKQFLAIYSSIPERNAPIMNDARKALQILEQKNV